MSLEEALLIAEKIDSGIDDPTTRDPRFDPLYRHPFLAELFLYLMRSLDTGINVDFHRDNFVNVCEIMCPEFSSILSDIEVPELDIMQISNHMRESEPDILSPV